MPLSSSSRILLLGPRSSHTPRRNVVVTRLGGARFRSLARRGGFVRPVYSKLGSMPSLPEALLAQRPCSCACHETLAVPERVAGVRALYVCDDALRGFGYVPLYELHGDALWREAQRRG